MKKLKLTLLMFTVALFTTSVNSQNTNKAADWCQTDKNYEEMVQKNPNLVQDHANYINEIRSAKNQASSTKKVSPYIIPVVFHVMTDNGAGYVSKADIDAVLVTLNEDFQRMNSDASSTRSQFLPYVASTDIQFRLAHLDPNGNCTEGIVRMDTPLATDAGDAVKSVSYWDSKKYFNVWSVNSIAGGGGGGIIAGYAQFPWSGINSTYGIVIDYNFVGANERTLTHEIGHCFSILHTFQSGCGGNCSNTGDWICDTPPSSTSSFGCPNASTCSNDASGPSPYVTNEVDQYENYMSYNACQNMWSLDQMSDMEGVLNSTSTSTGLNQLNTTANRAATGVADPYNPAICAPIADFDYDKDMICVGSSVTYTDNSYNATPTAFNWTFNNGTPGTSSLANPTVTYNIPGIHSTTHQPSTSGGSGTITKNSIITVSSLTADYSGVLVDGFENTSQFNADWIIKDPSGGESFMRTTSAAATGSASVWIRNFLTNAIGENDELISPSYDLSTLSNPAFKFKVAFARRTTSNADRLLVWWSLDCGETWVLKLPMVGGSLETSGGVKTSFWTPTANDWVEKTIDLSSITTETNVRFKFAFQSGEGNNLYLDDINIDGTVSIEDPLNNIGSFNVYPNPSTNGSATISFNLTKNVNTLEVSLIDVLGKEVTKVINSKSFAPGKYTLDVDKTHKLESGIYFIRFSADDNVKVKKLIVQ
jgi:PKD repeat protein